LRKHVESVPDLVTRLLDLSPNITESNIIAFVTRVEYNLSSLDIDEVDVLQSRRI
jgi:hypothetical protein